MNYKSLQSCVDDLETNNHLIRIKHEVDPYLEMASIQRQVYSQKGPALFFENVKDTAFPCLSNLYGTQERCHFIFRKQWETVKEAIKIKANPEAFLQEALKNFYKKPQKYLKLLGSGLHSLPKKIPIRKKNQIFKETTINQLPQITSWPEDGGAFITLPQVFSLDPGQQAIMKSNLGMYRVQMSGNEFIPNQELGMHYQIHRGIGVQHKKALDRGEDLPVTIFIGGPPAHSVAAVMPMPENMSELIFAGLLAGRRFRYIQLDNHILSADADFCITGWIKGKKVKPEGPFGDHLGYYSLRHDFPVFEVEKVYHKKNAIWPFTVVGRPPQEDTSFGSMIHELTSPMVGKEIPGVKELHAVDEAGVHPLLLAIGSERYTPYKKTKAAETLTQAHAILGFNQCSLAKYLFIASECDDPNLRCHDVEKFFKHILKRIDWAHDLHFQTNTHIDTLDYSGQGLNQGSKLILACVGPSKRDLKEKINFKLKHPFVLSLSIVTSGILSFKVKPFKDYKLAQKEIDDLTLKLSELNLEGYPLIVLCDDDHFCSESFGNFLWISFTRSNPSHDIYGVRSFTQYKHWGCHSSLIIDARIKPHHAPPLVENKSVYQKTKSFVDLMTK
ncbi:MAG: 3-octaprenyl-4-hydroxybenzoate carboxy-lyase [Zetaproteobacteria bacterium]|nr:3-octaprenyl-4-hydroxybenzoate carboxy-lyase [Pseudobdellovibrionaceae bacterium]